MKCRLALLLAASATTASAQWTRESYFLPAGWSAIYMLNDASHATIDAQLAAYPAITKVWRWVPSNLQSTFLSSPTDPVQANEWKTWVRGQPQNTTMNTFAPGHGYLVYVSGTQPVNLQLTGKALLVKPQWHSSGANLLGFPVAPFTPGTPLTRFGSTTGGYFAPMVPQGYNPATTLIYQYIGGEITPTTNPQRVSPLINAGILRGRAYWIDMATVSDYASPVLVEVNDGRGLGFGSQGGPQKIIVRNRSNAPLTVTLTPTASEPPPPGQQPVEGMVPLRQRVWNATTQQFDYTPAQATLTADLAAGASTEWTLAPDRTAMTAAPGSLYATALRITDSGAHGSYSLQYVPVTATTSGLGGLWVGEAVISQVQNQLQRYRRNADGTNAVDEQGQFIPEGPPVTNAAGTAQPFRLRLILHVDANGTARLLSNVYAGKVSTLPPGPGFTARQSALVPTEVAKATRITATHLPLDVVQTCSGNFGAGATLAATVNCGANDPVNPFLHTYHPDHDNLDPRFAGPAAETFAVSRAVSLTVDSAAAAVEPGWGVSTFTGQYTETLTGLHKNPVTIGGRFTLKRLSEITTFVP